MANNIAIMDKSDSSHIDGNSNIDSHTKKITDLVDRLNEAILDAKSANIIVKLCRSKELSDEYRKVYTDGLDASFYIQI
ncbi:MAG: hypothetical protein QM743_03285 [Chitinophagaceae bacterium]